MKSDMTWGEFCFSVICCIVFGAMGFAGCVSATEKTLRREAIEAGVARYETDPKTGETKFVFIKP